MKAYLSGWTVLALTACADYGAGRVRPGQSLDEVMQMMGQPTGRYALPDGAARIEYARGPLGRNTYMIDLDAAGRVQHWAQVLDPWYFAQVSDGMTGEQLLRLLGRPAERAGQWLRRETWSWRYENNDCLWFRVTLSADGRVIDGGATLPDPRCDPHDAVRD